MAEPDHDHLLLIVVGAHLRAEVCDRPLAYRLVDTINTWLDQHRAELSIDIQPTVCTDVWYVNTRELHARPTISIGGPGVNALSAYFAQKLHAAYVRDEQIMVQLDPEFVDLRASVWGMNHDLTVQSVDLFKTRYLDDFLRAVATQVEPHVE